MDITEIYQKLSHLEELLLSQKAVLNFNEVAVYTGLSKSYLYKLTCSGGIPCYKPQGKQIYFSKQEIDQWLLQNKKATINELESQAATFVTLSMGGSK
jgi:excisionase family DNA binding protein